MGKGKTITITIAIIVVVLVAILFAIASQTNIFLAGDYFVRIDNAHISKNETTGGVIHLTPNEPFVYELDAVNGSGDKARIVFGVSRELRQDALLKLELQPIRGVVSWAEVSAGELPPKAAEALG